MQKNSHARSVKQTSPQLYWFLLPISCLVLLDEWIKSIALQRLPFEGDLFVFQPIQLAIHKNFGIAFDIPFKMPVIVFFSIVIGFVLLQTAYKNRLSKPNIAIPSLMIVIGALGNLFDRLYYGFTVDYLIFFGTSAINISDIIIVSGVLLLLFTSRKQKNKLTKQK